MNSYIVLLAQISMIPSRMGWSSRRNVKASYKDPLGGAERASHIRGAYGEYKLRTVCLFSSWIEVAFRRYLPLPSSILARD